VARLKRVRLIDAAMVVALVTIAVLTARMLRHYSEGLENAPPVATGGAPASGLPREVVASLAAAAAKQAKGAVAAVEAKAGSGAPAPAPMGAAGGVQGFTLQKPGENPVLGKKENFVAVSKK
jgi:hypothetical protein